MKTKYLIEILKTYGADKELDYVKVLGKEFYFVFETIDKNKKS